MMAKKMTFAEALNNATENSDELILPAEYSPDIVGSVREGIAASEQTVAEIMALTGAGPAEARFMQALERGQTKGCTKAAHTGARKAEQG
jgi:hypothetical protein